MKVPHSSIHLAVHRMSERMNQLAKQCFSCSLWQNVELQTHEDSFNVYNRFTRLNAKI